MGLAKVTALALLPALGNFAGALLAERVEATGRRLNLALHAAAGIVLAVIGVELLPRALGGAPPWQVVAAFALGGGAAVLIKYLISRLERSHGGGRASSWMIYIAVAVDLFSDGLLIGAGSSVAFGLALLLALAQVTADLPEGFATIADLKRRGYARHIRLLLAAGFVLPVVGAAALSYWLLRGQASVYQLLALAFAGGLLIVVASEDMMPEAHESAEDVHASALTFVGGFSLFTLVSAYFG